MRESVISIREAVAEEEEEEASLTFTPLKNRAS